jgi:hypothetical protein
MALAGMSRVTTTRAGADDCAIADAYAGQDNGIGADPAISADANRFALCGL